MTFKAACIVKSLRYLYKENDSKTNQTLALNQSRGYRLIYMKSSKEEVMKKKTRIISDSDEDSRFVWKFRDEEISQCLPFIFEGEKILEVKGAIIHNDHDYLKSFSFRESAER